MPPDLRKLTESFLGPVTSEQGSIALESRPGTFWHHVRNATAAVQIGAAMNSEPPSLRRLLDDGVPYPLAVLTIATWDLDRASGRHAEHLPAWLRDDGDDGLTMLGHGLDDGP